MPQAYSPRRLAYRMASRFTRFTTLRSRMASILFVILSGSQLFLASALTFRFAGFVLGRSQGRSCRRRI
jgi:hypothetical protein